MFVTRLPLFHGTWPSTITVVAGFSASPRVSNSLGESCHFDAEIARRDAMPCSSLRAVPRRYSTMTTNPVPQPGHSLVSCELHIGAFSGFAQSMNLAWTFIASLYVESGSSNNLQVPVPGQSLAALQLAPFLLPPIQIPQALFAHLPPRTLTVAKPLIVFMPVMGILQGESTIPTRY